MTTKTEITAAYATVMEAEKQLVQDLEALANQFTSALTALADGFPTDAAMTPARSFLARIQSAIAMPMGYDLTSVKQQYGLNPVPIMPVAMPLATPTEGGTNG